MGIFNRIWNDSRGNMIMMAAILMIPMIGTVGLAVDTARIYAVRAQLQAALDAAALAGGRLYFMPPADRNASINAFFQENLDETRYGATFSPVTVTDNFTTKTLTLTATAMVPTTIISVINNNPVMVAATSEILRSDSTLELALVMDVTGSMCTPCSKIAAAKVAAKNLLDIIFQGENPADPKVFVSLVPFTDIVRVSPGGPVSNIAPLQYQDWTVPDDPANPADHSVEDIDWNGGLPGRGSWGGCMFARDYPDDIRDTPPGFGHYFYPYVKFTPAPWASFPMSGLTALQQNNYYLNMSIGPLNNDCQGSYPVVQPLTSSKATLVARVNALATNGSTQTTVGSAWGWRTISPRWRGLWQGVNAARPLPYTGNDPVNYKALVLMTDGENNFLDWTEYGALMHNRLGSTNYNSAVGNLNARQLELCDMMKTEGIRIYTIGFQLTVPSAITMLQNCAAGSGGKFFAAATAAELTNAFKAIASDLAALRLSK